MRYTVGTTVNGSNAGEVELTSTGRLSLDEAMGYMHSLISSSVNTSSFTFIVVVHEDLPKASDASHRS